MEGKAWAKTLLEIYRYLETICSTIDDIVKKTSLDGFSNVSYLNSTRFSAEKIIELTYKKKKLINIKILVEDGLNKLDDYELKILTLFYVDGVSAKIMSKMYNMNIRTFFRHKAIALSHLFAMFKELGYDKEKLNEELKSEHWIMNIYENNLSFLSSKSDKEINIENILKRAVLELKNFSKQRYAANIY